MGVINRHHTHKDLMAEVRQHKLPVLLYKMNTIFGNGILLYITITHVVHKHIIAQSVK